MNETREYVQALMAANEGSHHLKAMQRTTALLTDDNAEKIKDLLANVSSLTPNGAEAYERVLETCKNSTPRIANAVTLAWRHGTELTELDRSSLRPAAKLYDVHLDTNRDNISQTSKAAAVYLEQHLQKLRAEAERLKNLRLSILDHGQTSVTKAPAKKRLQAFSPIDSLLSRVPARLARLINKTGENELEMRFPLTNLTKLQKVGMRAGDAQDLLIRLMYGGRGMIPGYCVHLSNENRSTDVLHTPWLFSSHEQAPHEQYCHGRPNLASYQVSRILWRHLQDGFVSLEDTWNRVATNVCSLAGRCPVCGTHHKDIRLLRSTVCRKHAKCKHVIAARSFQWHLHEVWEDLNVFDLLLTMIHATSLTDQISLLHDCPIEDASTLEVLIDSIPPINQFEKQLTRSMTRHGSAFKLIPFLEPYVGYHTSNASSLAAFLK